MRWYQLYFFACLIATLAITQDMLHVPMSLIPAFSNASPPPKRSVRASVTHTSEGTAEALVSISEALRAPNVPDALNGAVAAEAPTEEAAPAKEAPVKEAPTEEASPAKEAAAPTEEATALAEAAKTDDDVIEVELTADLLERTKTLRQLKDMCTERNLVNTGKKSELAARLLA